MNSLGYINKKILSIALVALTVFTYSCKDNAAELTSVNYPRNFSVQNIKFDKSQQTSIGITWDKSKNSASSTNYTIEISEDQTFANGAEFTFQSDLNTIRLTDDDLNVRVPYYARIKANENEKVEESKWSISTSFMITGVQYLKAIKYEDITSTTVNLNWTVPNEVTKLKLNGVDYLISDVEKSSGTKSVTGLTPSTSYKVVIYNGNADKGTVTFSTKAGIPSGNIINVAPSDDLGALMSGAANGDIFVLQQGGKYSISTVNLKDGSITLFGEEGPNKPILNVTGQINLPISGGVIRFQNIHFSGFANGDITQTTKRNYIINQSAATSVEELVFENCEIRHLTNSPIRLQSTSVKSIQKLTIEQCVVEDIGVNAGGNGTYSFINNNVANNEIKNISITNSTFSDIGYGLILHNSTPSTSVTIDYCTFYNVIGNARFFIDYNAQSYGTLKINNSVIAKSLSALGTAGGIRGAGTLAITQTYKTSDFVTSSTSPFTGISSYTGTSADLFTDPALKNFIIKDATFEGKASAGDPRWR